MTASASTDSVAITIAPSSSTTTPQSAAGFADLEGDIDAVAVASAVADVPAVVAPASAAAVVDLEA